jgi:selenocysteine lyase/cysteine desulfurase
VTSTVQTANLRGRILGVNEEVPLLDGSRISYVNLDNAASTPPFQEVMDEVGRFMPFYSSIHRGTGFKSRLSTEAYERAREIIGEFVGADLSTNSVIFGKNTTEAINKLSYRLPLADDAVVITTMMEHHSNDLPWRGRANVVHVAVTPEGRLDEDDFDRQLEKHSGRIALVAVSGASNVTGFIQPIHELARKTHEHGGLILVDAAQLAPHREVDMKSDGDPEHIDFVAISAHKMYAPFGTGALIGPNEIFMQGAPEYRGGGTVDVVTADEVEWAGMPDRDEAGSPNVVGALAMAVAARVLMDVGMDQIAAHEGELVRYTLERLGAMKGITVYGETDPARASEKVGAIPFNLEGVSHFLVAAILGYEAGVGVRSGCFCAHPYVVHLLKLSDEEAATWREQLLGGDKSSMPGMIRMSFGCYNNFDDIDRLLEMLERIATGDYQGDYQLDISSGEYLPANYEEPIAEYLPLGMHSS